MADVRNFRNYIEELSGNNLLKKKMAALERANTKLERELKALKDEIKELKKNGAVAAPKKRGRKPRTMLQIIEAEMGKAKDNRMKVTDLVKALKKSKFESKAQNMYASVAASMNNSDKFQKVAPGEYQLVAEASAPKAATKKAAAKKKSPAKKKAVAKKKPAAKKKAAPKKKAAAKKKPVAKKKAATKKKAAPKKKAVKKAAPKKRAKKAAAK